MDDLYRALPGLLRAAPDSEEVAEAAVFVVWRRIAGENLNRCAVAFRLHRKTLVVSVLDEAWQRQLDQMRWNLTGRLNALLGGTYVTNIEFRIDPRTVRAARPAQAPDASEQAARAARSRARSAELLPHAAAIKDPELRARFLTAAGSCLEAQRK